MTFQAPTTGPKRILVVDDEPLNRSVAQVILTDAGFDVAEAENGQAAVEHCAQSLQMGLPVHAVLMDLQMPVLDGLGATRQLREMPSMRSVPIICLSARETGLASVEAKAAGADFFMAKPYKRHQLLAMLAEAMAGSTGG